MGERRAGLVLGPGRDLEVDQRQPAVRVEQDVVRVQVAEDDAALVQLPDGLLDLGDHRGRPLGVLGLVGLGRVRVRQRIAPYQLALQRTPSR